LGCYEIGSFFEIIKKMIIFELNFSSMLNENMNINEILFDILSELRKIQSHISNHQTHTINSETAAHILNISKSRLRQLSKEYPEIKVRHGKYSRENIMKLKSIS
jgi:hypothetical protein